MNSWQNHLREASPTLAMSAESLEEPLRRIVTLGALTIHAIHAVEAAIPWPPLQLRRAVQQYVSLAQDPTVPRARRLASDAALKNDLLIASLPHLVASIESLPEGYRLAIWHHAKRAAEQSLAFVLRTRADGQVVLTSPEELAHYCAARTGIITELLTDLILEKDPSLEPVADSLRALSAACGEVVGLIDCLDDADAQRCRAHLLDPSHRQHVIALARARMKHAERYVDALRAAGAPRDVTAFVSLPVAWAKLRLDRVVWGEGLTLDRSSWAPATTDHRASELS